MKQPLGLVALVYAAGLMLGHFIEAPLVAAFVLCFLLAVLAFLVAHVRALLLFAAMFLLGWLNLSVRTAHVSPCDIRTIVADRPQLVSVRGRLAETPSERVYISDEKESWRTLALLQLEAVQLHFGDWQPAVGKVLTTTGGTLGQNFVEGQGVELDGVILLPARPVAEGLFDYRRYLEGKGIAYQLKVESADQWRLHGEAVSRPFTVRFREWGQRALAMGLPEQDESLRLQWAMLLGWQTALTSEVSEPFMKSGTMHIFAISGLHIALIAGIFLALLRALTVPRIVCGAIVLPLIWFYTAATGWQASAIRSTVMMTVVICGWMLRRPTNLLNSLAVAALIILVWDPFELFQASFQLSFFVVLSIAVLAPLLESAKERVVILDPLLPFELRPGWQRLGIRAGRTAWKAFVVSLAAFLGSLPLTAYYFHLFTPGSLLANLVVVPVSSGALVCGLGALVTAPIAPAVAELFNHSGWAFMRLMVWLSERATELPGSWMHVASPGITVFLLYYTSLLALLTRWQTTLHVRRVAIAFITLLGTIVGLQWYNSRAEAEVSVMPLTGTHVVLARDSRKMERWLVNCGSHKSFSLLLKPWLQAQGINRLAHLILARGDSQHSGAMVDLHGVIPVGQAWAAPHKSLSKPFRDTLEDFSRATSVSRMATNGASIGPWRVLHPDAVDKFRRGQDYAVCLLGHFEGVNVLLLPDLSLVGQNALFNRLVNVRADVVVAGLPDTGEPLASELVAQLKPKLIIIADCEYPAARRAPAALRDRLRRTGIPVVFTRDAGAVTLRVKAGEWTVRRTLAENTAVN